MELPDNPTPFKPYPVKMPGREVYNARRFIEVSDTDFKSPQWAQGHAFIRLDSGSIEPISEKSVEEFINKTVVPQLNSETRFDCIILADYDLGLFTEHFIETFKKCIEDCKCSKIPIVVYSGRKMSKYRILENCWIVVDLSEARDDIEENPDPQKEPSFQFGKIIKKYPDLKGLIVVGGKETAMASWECSNGWATYRPNYQPVDMGTYRTPLGHRGLIASYLGLKLAEGGETTSILPMAHNISNYKGAILIGEFGLADAIKIRKREQVEREKFVAKNIADPQGELPLQKVQL
jgi:bifunctional ADP-heptose synthase (sugar kinase/adenylyltransferase)